MSKCQRDAIAAKVDNQMTSLTHLGVRDRGLTQSTIETKIKKQQSE
jgi:hypothetical protein